MKKSSVRMSLECELLHRIIKYYTAILILCFIIGVTLFIIFLNVGYILLQFLSILFLAIGFILSHREVKNSMMIRQMHNIMNFLSQRVEEKQSKRKFD